MEQADILKEVNRIFIEVLNDPSISLNDSTVPDDVEAWDSLNHIYIITAIEKFYKIRFNLNDLLNFKNVGDLCNGIRIATEKK